MTYLSPPPPPEIDPRLRRLANVDPILQMMLNAHKQGMLTHSEMLTEAVVAMAERHAILLPKLLRAELMRPLEIRIDSTMSPQQIRDMLSGMNQPKNSPSGP